MKSTSAANPRTRSERAFINRGTLPRLLIFRSMAVFLPLTQFLAAALITGPALGTIAATVMNHRERVVEGGERRRRAYTVNLIGASEHIAPPRERNLILHLIFIFSRIQTNFLEQRNLSDNT